MLEGLEGVVCQIDDVLVFRKDLAEHDAQVVAALERIEKAGKSLNSEKCEFRKDRVKSLLMPMVSEQIQRRLPPLETWHPQEYHRPT